MSIRNLWSWLLLVAVSFTVGARTFAQGEWAVEQTFHVGGEGGFDYITADAKNHRLYVPRSAHTMVIDTDSGKLVADITGPVKSLRLLFATLGFPCNFLRVNTEFAPPDRCTLNPIA